MRRFASASEPAGIVLRLVLLVLLATALLFPGLRHAPIERAEIYFLDVARTMVETGDYLVPRYRGEDFFDKPPLTYWAIAGAFRIGGFTLGTARMVPAVAGVLALLATVWLGFLLVGRRAALAGGLVFITTLGVVSFGRLAMSDMLLTVFCTLAVALAILALRPNPSPLLVPALGLVFGLGFLTKGPVALLLPGLGIGFLLFRLRKHPPSVPRRVLWSAVALFALSGLGWFVAVYLRLGHEPLAYFFLRENMERFAGEAYDVGRSPWYYLGAYLIQGLPWSFLFPVAVFRRWRASEPATSENLRFLIAWVGLMAIPLSFSRGKLDYYLLPLYPAVSLLIGWLVTELSWDRFERAWSRATLVLLASGLGLSVMVRTRIPVAWLPEPELRRWLGVGAVMAALLLLLLALRPTANRVLLTVAGTATAAYLSFFLILTPWFRGVQPNRTIVRDVARELEQEPQARLALCRDPARVQRDILFHTRLAAEEFCDLWNPASAKAPFLLLVQQRERSALKETELRVAGEYRYIPASAFSFSGLWKRYDADELALLANYTTDDPITIARAKRHRKKTMEALAEQELKKRTKKNRGKSASPSDPPR